MFFAGFAFIILIWFAGSLIRGKGFKQFSYAELLAGFFALFFVTFVVGLTVNPAAPGVWGFTLFGYVLLGLTTALIISISMQSRSDDTDIAAKRTGVAVQDAHAKKYQMMFIGLTVGTMLLALVSRLLIH